MSELDRTRPEAFFSTRFDVTPAAMEHLLGATLARRVDDADIYLEYRVNEELVLEENVVKKASRHVSQGAGVRAQAGARTGYAHTDDISIQNLDEAARQARAIADRATRSGTVAIAGRGRPHDLYTLAEPPIVTELARKLALLRQVDAACRAADPRVKQVESDQIVQAMQEKKIPVTYVLFPDEGHGFARPENRLAFYAVTEAFLACYLGGRYEAIGESFEGSTISVPEGAGDVPGLEKNLPEREGEK